MLFPLLGNVKKRAALVPVFLMLFGAFPLFGESLLEKADRLEEDLQYHEGLALLKEALPGISDNRKLAEVYWRLSRFQLLVTDELRRQDAHRDRLLEGYEAGREYADKSLELAPGNYKAYYWRGSNIGRWGQSRGVLSALFRASDMRDDLERAIEANPAHGDSYYVLGMLYNTVPGGIVSFGSSEYAVSLGRKSLEYQEGPDPKYSYYLELAKSLWDRNWNNRRRNSRHDSKRADYLRARSQLEKAFHYEGMVDFSTPLPYASQGVARMSDRDEARAIANWLQRELQRKRDKTPGEQDTFKEVQELLNSW